MNIQSNSHPIVQVNIQVNRESSSSHEEVNTLPPKKRLKSGHCEHLQNDSPIANAISNGNTDQITRLIHDHHDIDINQILNDQGDTLAHIAAHRNWPGVMESLVNRGANLECKNKRSLEPLDVAFNCSNDEIAAKIINASTAEYISTKSVHTKGTEGNLFNGVNVLQYAIMNRLSQATEEILRKKCINPNTPFQFCNPPHRPVSVSPLAAAADFNLTQVGLLLLKQGADPNQEKSGFAISLAYAIMRKNDPLAAEIAKSVDCAYLSRKNFLKKAIELNLPHTVEQIVRKGQPLGRYFNDDNPLSTAIALNRTECVQKMFKERLNVNPSLIRRYLGAALDKGRVEIACELVKYICKFDQRSLPQHQASGPSSSQIPSRPNS